MGELRLCGYFIGSNSVWSQVPDVKLNTGPETIFEGISFIREEEETFSSGGIFLKTSGCIRYLRRNTVLEVLRD